MWNLFQVVWRTERIPEKWKRSTIIQIEKSKSKLGDLEGIRHIHDKDEFFKFFGNIVTQCAKETILRNMPRFQIACRPGHRPSEHLFVIRSIIQHYIGRKKSFLIIGYDLKKFFDFENLRDCLRSLYTLGVRGKIYRLLYKMNEKVKIEVKTPVGTSDSAEVKEIVSQGSPEAALISSANVSAGVDEAFANSDKEIKYHDINLNPQSYMDDVIRMAENRNNAQYGNDKMEEMVKKKVLQFNLDKSNYMIVGSKKGREKLNHKIPRRFSFV